jgi:MoxR-like ATPase
MAEAVPFEKQLQGFRDDAEALRREIGKVVVGMEAVVEGLLAAAVCGGHVLIEGPPGVGKTLLVETFAAAVQLSFQRIQFTPDLMPADLLGTHVIMETPQGRRTFEFQQGPIFSNVVLADHVNRGLPKTQAALLEAMEGQSIDVATESFQLPQPFLVMATQNPAESEGTFPLPEPTLDRFFFKLVAPSPTADEIERILERTTEGVAADVQAVIDGRRLLEMREIARKVACAAPLRRWAAALVAASHPQSPRAPEAIRRLVGCGASPRAAQAIVMGGKARAAAEGRPAATADDLRAAAHAALRHRLILGFEGQAEGADADRLVDALLAEIPVD